MAVNTSLKGDDMLVVIFRASSTPDGAKSALEGRPIHVDGEECQIRVAGSRNWQPFPATAFSHWAQDDETGEMVRVTYAERFTRQYRQFKSHETQTKTGTPLSYAPFLTEARRAEMRALNIYTIEQLAFVEGQELKNLGPYGREYKNLAQEFIDEAKRNVPNLTYQAEMEALRAKNAVLEDDLTLLKARVANSDAKLPDNEYDGMSIEQLRELITVRSGHPPHGMLNHQTLVRMAQDSRPTT